MTSQERNLSPGINGGTVPVGKSTGRSSLSPLRHRHLGRASVWADVAETPGNRRSSNFSDSLDSTRQSLKSSTDDLLLPRARNPDLASHHESSHWHSAPLALALFPALGGLFFHNGSVVVTDMTLLALAAIILNWAVRLPWVWYLSTQSIRTKDSQPFATDYPSDTIIEEGSDEEDEGGQPAPVKPDTKDASKKTPGPSPAQSSAASELRIHETLALSACFISPAIGAWLLHHIRCQLSRPSEGLVSNYNLTIFLLASEARPVSHLIKLVQARTLHLQRTLATNPYTQDHTTLSPSMIQDLSSRLAELETHVADNTFNGAPAKASSADLMNQCRKSVQPDLDALNRAVRRYEKRATLLSLQTESRLQELEKRMSDAITLAAAAERSSLSSRQRRGSGVGLVMDWVAMIALLPLQLGWSIISLPGRLIGSVVSQVEGYVGQKIRREMKTAGKTENRAGSGTERRKVQARGPKKVI